MFLIRRKCFTTRANAWKVASILQKICNEYEEQGRSEATIYVSGFSIEYLTPAWAAKLYTSLNLYFLNNFSNFILLLKSNL